MEIERTERREGAVDNQSHVPRARIGNFMRRYVQMNIISKLPMRKAETVVFNHHIYVLERDMFLELLGRLKLLLMQMKQLGTLITEIGDAMIDVGECNARIRSDRSNTAIQDRLRQWHRLLLAFEPQIISKVLPGLGERIVSMEKLMEKIRQQTKLQADFNVASHKYAKAMQKRVQHDIQNASMNLKDAQHALEGMNHELIRQFQATWRARGSLTTEALAHLVEVSSHLLHSMQSTRRRSGQIMATAVNPKTHAIAELMQKLKAGEISKAELFLHLSKLQPTNVSVSVEKPSQNVFKRGTSFAASIAENEQQYALRARPTQALYDTDRAGVSHDQAKLMSVQQLLASRLAVEKNQNPTQDETRSPAFAFTSGANLSGYNTPMQSSPNMEENSFSEGAAGSISPLDGDYDNSQRYVHYMDEDSFHVRVSRWKQQKENLKEKLKQEQLEVELTECTFQPMINPDVVNYKLRDEIAQRAREQEEQDQQRECTFKPHLNKSSMVPSVRSKYKEPVYSKKFNAPLTQSPDLDECTFNPKINPIPKDMVSAQLYTQQNIFDRLSRPLNTMETPETQDDNSTELTLDGRRSFDEDSCVTVTQHDPSRPASAGSVGEAEDRKKRFDEFMRRQKAQERERQRKLDEARKSRGFQFKPSINKKSNEIMQQGRKGDFIERVAKYALRKEHDKLKKKSIKLQDPQCTFKPKINEASAKRNPRSVTELSRGDLLKRETTQRLMKLRMEQHEMAQLTFKPTVNSSIPNVESKLKVLSNPETYVQRLQEHTLKLYEKQRKALQEQEIEEFSECTFKPQTIDVPSYISRIARSMELTKALKAKQTQHQQRRAKPDWK